MKISFTDLRLVETPTAAEPLTPKGEFKFIPGSSFVLL